MNRLNRMSMEKEEKSQIAYHKNVIDFIAVAAELCHFLESEVEISRNEWVERILKLLPLLYVKTLLLPQASLLNDECPYICKGRGLRTGCQSYCWGDGWGRYLPGCFCRWDEVQWSSHICICLRESGRFVPRYPKFSFCLSSLNCPIRWRMHWQSARRILCSTGDRSWWMCYAHCIHSSAGLKRVERMRNRISIILKNCGTNHYKRATGRIAERDLWRQNNCCRSREEVAEAVAHLSNHRAIGFDTETKPSFKRGQNHKVALMQLATDEVCYLFRLNHIGYPDKLVHLMSNPDIKKIGLSCVTTLPLSGNDRYVSLRTSSICSSSSTSSVSMTTAYKRYTPCSSERRYQRVSASPTGRHLNWPPRSKPMLPSMLGPAFASTTIWSIPTALQPINKIKMYQSIQLKPKKDESLRRFHPWVFSGALAQAPSTPAEGDVVRVLAADGSFLGWGITRWQHRCAHPFLYDQPIDHDFYWQRSPALTVAKKSWICCVATIPFGAWWRDHLPGLIIDLMVILPWYRLTRWGCTVTWTDYGCFERCDGHRGPESYLL